MTYWLVATFISPRRQSFKHRRGPAHYERFERMSARVQQHDDGSRQILGQGYGCDNRDARKQIKSELLILLLANEIKQRRVPADDKREKQRKSTNRDSADAARRKTCNAHDEV